MNARVATWLIRASGNICTVFVALVFDVNSGTERNQKQVSEQQGLTQSLSYMRVVSDTGCLARVWWRSMRRLLILQKDQMIWMMILVRNTSICGFRILGESRVTCLILWLCSLQIILQDTHLKSIYQRI